MIDVVLDIAKLKPLELAAKGETMTEKITGNKHFKDEPIDTGALSQTSIAYRKAYETTFKGDTAGQKEKEGLKNDLILNIKIVANDVSSAVLKGLLNKTLSEEDAEGVVYSAGLSTRKKATKKGFAPKVTRLNATNNEAEGCMDLSYFKSKITDSFVIRVRKKGETEWKEYYTKASKYMIKDLNRGDEYEFCVAGINTKGRGEFSNIVSEIAL